jgi:hypothetical protein
MKLDKQVAVVTAAAWDRPGNLFVLARHGAHVVIRTSGARAQATA